MKICYVASDEGGCTHYRADLPLAQFPKYTHHKVKRLSKFDPKLDDYVNSCDVYVMPRPQGEESVHLMDILHANGKKVVVDYDDDCHAVSPLSPHYEAYGTENVTISYEGQEIPLWVDGQNGFNIEQNKRVLDTIQRCIEKADMVTTTTPILAERFSKWNSNVHPIPNSVDLAVWAKLDLPRKDEIRMGWAGGASHFEDWNEIAEALPLVMAKYPKLKLVIVGHHFQGTTKGIDPARIEFHPWVHTQAYPYVMAKLNLDFAIIPLKDTHFNAGKSNIKWVEFAALQVPSVTSAVSPYIEWQQEDNGIFCANNKSSWVSGISLMVEDSILRAKMSQSAHQTVKDHFDIANNWKMWVRAFEKVR